MEQLHQKCHSRSMFLSSLTSVSSPAGPSSLRGDFPSFHAVLLVPLHSQQQEFSPLPGQEDWDCVWLLGAVLIEACCLWFQGIACPDCLIQPMQKQGAVLGLLQVVLVLGMTCSQLLIGIEKVQGSGLASYGTPLPRATSG